MRSEHEKQPSREQLVAGLPDEYVACRALGHLDREELGYGVHDSGGALQVNWAWLRAACDRCGRVRRSFFDAYFGLMGTTYDYPPSYLLEGAGRGPARREARQELWQRRAGAPPQRRRRGGGARG
jgi:hypothetical protein